ncbi:hypothetical protein [Sphingomonas sp.]|uniref:hypothetical protein n=1 Tax=Sphingomonas sp. TaxID=28214 RepID=UPI00307DE0F7
MKTMFYAIALLSGAACSQQQAPEPDLVMRTIEAVVKLPADAKPLDKYSRNYALRPDGKIVGIYVIPRLTEGQGGKDDCEVILKDLGSRPCTEAEKKKIADEEKAIAELFGQANQSRWFEDYRDLPMLLDGGCDQIEIVFDPNSRAIQSAQCNGNA